MTTKKIEQILIPLALTREGEIAMEQGVKFHEVFGSKLIIMNIIPRNRPLIRLTRRERSATTLEKAHHKLEEFVSKFFKGTIPPYVNLQVRCGRLIPTIIDASKDFSSQLIIIKKSKRIIGNFAAFRRNNADKLIGQSFCPVLTISEDFTHEGIREIVMPVDISKKTDDKVRWAIFLARSFNARVTVISVLDINIETRTSLAYRKAVTIEEQLLSENIDCDVLVITDTSGHHYENFLRQVNKVNPDLIVIMTHEESLLFGEYIGTFAREVIHRAEQPVFNVVPRVGTLFDVFDEGDILINEEEN